MLNILFSRIIDDGAYIGDMDIVKLDQSKHFVLGEIFDDQYILGGHGYKLPHLVFYLDVRFFRDLEMLGAPRFNQRHMESMPGFLFK